MRNMIPFPDKKYRVIYADPPWSYYNDSDSPEDKTTKVGVRKPPYPVLGSETIKKFPVASIADDPCLLFIWTTDYHLEKCLQIISCWGFQYKTVGFVWKKLNKSGTAVTFTGAYTLKSGVEFCLLATKGDAHKLVVSHKVRALIEATRQHHSKKPDEIRERISQLVGYETLKIELFAREKFEGWDHWGNEV